MLLSSSSKWYPSKMLATLLGLFLWSSMVVVSVSAQECFENNPELNEFFATDTPTCCQQDVCQIPCPEEVSPPTKGFGIAIIICIVISFLIGFATLFLVKGEAENFFVAGKSLPLWIVAMTLGAQSIDSNAILGNADLSYKFQFYDGAVLPIGLGLSLILNGIFLARHINREVGVLTLPDVLAKRYGKIVEIFVSIATIISFMMLLAGNLVGMGIVLAYVWQVTVPAGIWTTSAIVWAYTVSGGLFSVAYTDVAQGLIGWSGCVVLAYYMIANSDPMAPPPSIGFPGYMYPPEGGICEMYDGVPCDVDTDACCYNTDKWCPANGTECVTDNGAYPIGDEPVFPAQMSSFLGLSPFPNAIFFNWATIFVLGFGNLAALDFQARCMAAKTPSTATWGCLIGGAFTFFVGIPFSYMGGITRTFYGPDSVYAEFTADTCSEILGLPTCAMWVPDDMAFIKLLTHQAPAFLGGWCLFGIVAASMSTADGAILAMGTVFSHNLMRQLDVWYPKLITSDNLLNMARASTIPFTLAATLIATYNQQTGYLLIVAFDVVLATVVVPLFGCFYSKTPRPNAAFLAIIFGATTRIILEFTLPKDGYLCLPYDVPEFKDYGPGASTKLPVFVDAPPEEKWNAAEDVCDQAQLEDYTGVDSLSAFLVSIIVFVFITLLEDKMGAPLFTLKGLQPYTKKLHDDDNDDKEDTTAPHNEKDDDATKKSLDDSNGKVNSSEEEVVEFTQAETSKVFEATA